MKIIGITGASGSGKSTLVKLLGLKVIDADKVAKSVTEKGTRCLKELSESFGADILEKSGELNRKKLAEKAFSSKENTKLLNRITHPYIFEKIEEEIELLKKTENIVILDAPQLFEAGCEKLCDMTVGVLSDKDKRIERIIKRDSLTKAQALLRINAGKDDDFFKSNCDMIIINDGSLDKLRQEAQKIIKAIRS